MGWLRPRPDTGLRVGLGIHRDGISVARVMHPRRGTPKLLGCLFVPTEGEEAQKGEFARLGRLYKLKGVPASVVMAPGSYSLLQVERPEVEEDEIRNAIRWRIKDLIDFHIDDAVLDLFDLPKSNRAGAPRLMYVVAAKVSTVQQMVDQLQAAGITIASIDITELALRNLIACLGDSTKTQALLYLAPRYGMIEIVRDSVLYLNRRIEINATDLQEQGGLGLDDLMDALVLELQRSLDYYESQFGAGQSASVSVVGPEERTGPLVEFADRNLSAAVTPLSLGECLEISEVIADGQLERCLPAIGAALRSD